MRTCATEILFREGAAMGLDRDDAVIRRRVLQKLGVITEESAARAAPSRCRAGGRTCASTPSAMRIPALVGFDQVMFDPARHGARLDVRSRRGARATACRRAKPDDDAATARCCRHRRPTLAADLLARDFGDEFADVRDRAAARHWSGPVASGYGVHLVRVTTSTPGRSGDARRSASRVERDWRTIDVALANEILLPGRRCRSTTS